MNENILAVLLIVITLALIAIVSIVIAILYKLTKHFNDMDHQYISIRNNLNRLVEFKDRRYITTCHRLDVIIDSLDELCNVCEDIYEDKYSVEVEDVEEAAKRKDLKEKKPDDGGCRDCMFVFKNEFEEPCNKCCHAYTTQFASRRNKE